MPHAIRTVIGITDKQVGDLFESLSKIVEREATYNVVGLAGGINPNDERLVELIKENSGVIKTASIGGTGFNVSFTARAIAQSESGSFEPHPYYSIIHLSVNDWQPHHAQHGTPEPNYDTALKCNIEVEKFIKRYKLDPGVLSADKSKTLDPHLVLISQIETSSVEQISRINNFFVELTEKFDERRTVLTEEFDQRHAGLTQENDARRSELQDIYDRKAADLEGARQELGNLKKEIDDRNNTHARRAIRGELINTLKDRQNNFSISKDTKSLRWPIHTIFIQILLFSALGAAWSLQQVSVGGSNAGDLPLILSSVKTAVFTFTFITTAGLYISWMNRWFDKHAEAQFQTKQFEIDINRASWAVEAALEWKGAQGEQMPDILLDGITRHLFESNKTDSTEYSPLETLATGILGSASNVNLDMNGSKIMFDRKSLKAIKKSES